MKTILAALIFSLPLIVNGQLNSISTVSDSIPALSLDTVPPLDIHLLGCAHGHICCQVACPCCPKGSGMMNHLLLPPMTRKEMKKYMRKQKRLNRSSKSS